MTMVRQTCPSTQEKNEDLVTELPSAIRESIFSLLSLKEAAATSIICHRWQHMWESSTRTLVFLDDINQCQCCFKILSQESREEKRRSYVDWVDKVMEQHTGPTIEQFKACFSIDHRFTSSIDKWILFALKKRVQVLVLDFCYAIIQEDQVPYIFPCKLLSLAGFESLKALHLSYVSLTAEDLECLLSNCQALERLTIIVPRNLDAIRVVGPSIPLKYLEIKPGGARIKSIEIRNVNLISFSYYGTPEKDFSFVFSNVPLLVEVSLLHHDFTRIALSQLSFCHSQLETLRLDASYGGLDFIRGISTLPALTSLKHLELEVNADHFYNHDSELYTSLSQVATLVKASPYLQRLVLKLRFYRFDDEETDYYDFRFPRKLEKGPKWQHHCLKVVEITGYRGRPHIVEYVMDLIENAVALEKIVIDPTQEPKNWPCSHVEPDRRDEKSKRPRDHAMHHLKRMVPSTIEFVCL